MPSRAPADLDRDDADGVAMRLRRASVNWRRAKRLHGRIEALWRRGDEPDAADYEVALRAYAEAAYPWQSLPTRTGGALRLLRQMCERGAAPTVGMYNEVLRACVPEMAWEWSLALLREMEERGLQPDQATFEHIIHTCTLACQWSWAARMLSEMERRGLEPTIDAYHRVLSCCAKMQQWKTVWKLFRHMEDSGVRPTRTAHEIAMCACGQGGDWRRAVLLLAQARQLPDCSVRERNSYTAAMDACGLDSQWALAVELLAGMEREGLEPDQFVFAAAARACQAGEEEELAEVLERRRASAREREAAAWADYSPPPWLRAKWEALAAARPRPLPPEVVERLDWGLV